MGFPILQCSHATLDGAIFSWDLCISSTSHQFPMAVLFILNDTVDLYAASCPSPTIPVMWLPMTHGLPALHSTVLTLVRFYTSVLPYSIDTCDCSNAGLQACVMLSVWPHQPFFVLFIGYSLLLNNRSPSLALHFTWFNSTTKWINSPGPQVSLCSWPLLRSFSLLFLLSVAGVSPICW